MASIVDRKYPRFSGSPLDVAYLDLDPARDTFEPGFAGLIFQEAYGGCGLIFTEKGDLRAQLEKGMNCRIKLGDLDPLRSEVVWIEEPDPHAIKVGFRFLEKMF